MHIAGQSEVNRDKQNYCLNTPAVLQFLFNRGNAEGLCGRLGISPSKTNIEAAASVKDNKMKTTNKLMNLAMLSSLALVSACGGEEGDILESPFEVSNIDSDSERNDGSDEIDDAPLSWCTILSTCADFPASNIEVCAQDVKLWYTSSVELRDRDRCDSELMRCRNVASCEEFMECSSKGIAYQCHPLEHSTTTLPSKDLVIDLD